MTDVTKRIVQLRESIRQADLKRVEYKTKLEAAKEKYEEAKARCIKYGIQPEQLPQAIEKLEEQMESIVNNIEELLQHAGV
jgi:chromosome segregation ATPase